MNLISSTYRKAHKEHVCSYCGRTIKKGQEYLVDDIADNGTVYCWKTCKQCEQLLEKYPLVDYTGDGIDCWDFLDHVVWLCKDHKVCLDDEGNLLDVDLDVMVRALLEFARQRETLNTISNNLE